MLDPGVPPFDFCHRKYTRREMYKEGKYTKKETCRLTLGNILTCPGPNRSIDKLGILLLMEHSSPKINDVDE